MDDKGLKTIQALSWAQMFCLNLWSLEKNGFKHICVETRPLLVLFLLDFYNQAICWAACRNKGLLFLRVGASKSHLPPQTGSCAEEWSDTKDWHRCTSSSVASASLWCWKMSHISSLHHISVCNTPWNFPFRRKSPAALTFEAVFLSFTLFFLRDSRRADLCYRFSNGTQIKHIYQKAQEHLALTPYWNKTSLHYSVFLLTLRTFISPL